MKDQTDSPSNLSGSRLGPGKREVPIGGSPSRRSVLGRRVPLHKEGPEVKRIPGPGAGLRVGGSRGSLYEDLPGAAILAQAPEDP